MPVLLPKTKLLGEFLIAGLVVWGANLSFETVQFLGLGSLSFPQWFGFGLSCLWIVGMANAINLIDGLDGLASGISLAGLLAVSVVGYLGGYFKCNMDVYFTYWMLTRLSGLQQQTSFDFSWRLWKSHSWLPCRVLNIARKFSGGKGARWNFSCSCVRDPDSGLCVCNFSSNNAWAIPFSPDMEHFHHRLMAKGLSHGKAVLAMWAMAFCCSLVAIAAAFGKGDQLFAIFVFLG